MVDDISDEAFDPSRHAVLIVDDEVTFRRALAEGISLLSGERYQPVCAGSVDEALSLLKSRPFAALVTDIRMPGKDGLQLLLEMKRQSLRVPTLVTTAYGSPSVHAQAARSGAVRYIEKPFPLEHLIEFLDGAISHAQSGRAQTLDLIEVVEMLCMGRRDMRVGVRTRDVQGSIFIKDGEIVHAESGDRVGTDVLLELLALPQAQISTDPGEQAPAVTISQPWRELTEEAWRRRTLAAAPVRRAAGPAPAPPKPAAAARELPRYAPVREAPVVSGPCFWAEVASSAIVERLSSMPGLVHPPEQIDLDDAHHAPVLLSFDGSRRAGQSLRAGLLMGVVVKTPNATLVYVPIDDLHAVRAACHGPALPERRLFSVARALHPTWKGAVGLWSRSGDDLAGDTHGRT